MKKILFTIFILLFVCQMSSAQSVGQVAKGLKPDGTYAPLLLDMNGKLITNAESTGGSTGTMTIILPCISLATTSYCVLATNSVTLFQTVASFSTGDLIMIQGRSRFYWSVTSNPTMTYSELQASGYLAEAGDTPISMHLRTSANLALVADPSSIATLTYSIVKEQ